MRQGQYPNPEVWQNTVILLRNVRERLANIKEGVQSTILDYHPYVDCMIEL
ncbi:hypothetical protein AGMMS5026_07790 [Endomicrobiia bacterium]|nr:hypothetical protein AGMMS49523_03310 [Endomicrobiia bacterium]GHT12211.1 hypothetical protein AGMMS49571_03820 [Endomicrobiia bacterium]GHT20568.1 hypothetical protein AGMMS49929_07570 [Endomicrobiia bacterium]GHT26138.1 hypothetical protein AGMMS49995_02120 [Endomicrobiia bacterium]GHT31441.1 hypothetical protein AGMMS5026_07790 [Endomicrobiia bacterium]